jgi:hypothetical protein
MWLSTLITCLSGSRAKKRRTPHGSRVKGQAISAPAWTAARVAGVHVIHLNRDIGDDRGGGVVGHEADLGTRPFGIGQGEI